MKHILLILALILAAVVGVGAAEADEADAGLYKGICQQCHQLPDPGWLKPHQWEKVLAVMQARMEEKRMPPLEPDTWEAIKRYVTKNARH